MPDDSTPSPKSPAKFIFWERRMRLWRARVVRNKQVVFDQRFKDVADAINASEHLVATYCRPTPKAERKPRPKADPAVPSWKRPGYRETYRRNQHDMHERRRVWYREFMRERVCSQCGADAHLEWHHRDPSSKTDYVGRMVLNRPTAMVMEEIAKCDLVCGGCHREIHRKLRKSDNV